MKVKIKREIAAFPTHRGWYEFYNPETDRYIDIFCPAKFEKYTNLHLEPGEEGIFVISFRRIS